MQTLDALLRPTFQPEKWIEEGWSAISKEEQKFIQSRLDDLFQNGLPLELKHDKILYIYAFSLLAQFEVLAIQIPLKFQSQLKKPQFREQMHRQLLDEIFHGLVFTKIVYMLCEPYALPPTPNEHIETLCNFIRNENCPKTALMLLNLIGEGWIEEIFHSFQQANIAPEVFNVIIEDEQRHVCEADLYREIGLPDMQIVHEKIAYLEEQLITNIFLQYKYMFSTVSLLGTAGTIAFTEALHKKHSAQLAKINLTPGKYWQFYMTTAYELFPKIHSYAASRKKLEMTPLRQLFMTQWDNPSDPTMVAEFDLNISKLDFFNKKFPKETLTTLTLQAISYGLSENDSFRNYLSGHQLYQSQHAYVGLIVKLPDCLDHIGTIIFQNAHTIPIKVLATKIKIALQNMVYCFKKREELEALYPDLKTITESTVFDFLNDIYDYPIPGDPVISLSNIGMTGYTRTKSPLRRNECMKFTLLAVQKKPVWNNGTHAFEPQDILPISISADHRIFDGNVPIAKYFVNCFDTVFQNMLNPSDASPLPQESSDLEEIINTFMEHNITLTYKLLTLLQTYWFDFLALEELAHLKPKLEEVM